MTRMSLIAVILGTAVLLGEAQQPPRSDQLAGSPDTPVIGRVYDARDGAALPRARVAIGDGAGPATPVLTDDRGRFVLTVPAGSAPRFSVHKAGYATTTVSISPADLGQVHEVTLVRGAAIEGRVLDPRGQPAVAATVVARRDGDQVEARGRWSFMADTDDQGTFRFGGLPAGRYDVRPLPPAPLELQAMRAASSVERLFSDAPADPAGAFVVTVEPGEEVSGLLIMPPRPAGRECPSLPIVSPPDASARSAIRGRVTAVGGAPLACVEVRAVQPGTPVRMTMTDDEGRYTIEGLASGAHTLEARLTGHIPLQYGQQRAWDARIVLTLGQDERLDPTDITMARGSVITGTVVDDHGEPMAGVSVRALRLRTVDGRTTVVSASRGRPRQTDDRGRYRLFGLSPGTYLVTAGVDAEISGPESPQTHGYAPVYYPGTTDVAGATRLQLEIGQDAPGVDLVFVPTPTARVTGVAVDHTGQPIRGMATLAASARSGAPALEPGVAPLGPDGSFSFTNVPLGDYVVQATGSAGPIVQPLASGAPASLPATVRVPPTFGMQYVTVVDSSPPSVLIRTSPGTTIQGHIRVEGPGADTGTPTPISLATIPADWDLSPAAGTGTLGFALDDEGRFSFAGLHGPRRITISAAPDSWYLKAVFIDGQDVTDRPFDLGLTEVVLRNAEIVVSTAGATVEGRVTDERGVPAGLGAVVVFPTDRMYWFHASRHVKVARSDPDGTFRATGLPPGSYYVAAVDAIEGTSAGGAWHDVEVLQALSSRARRLDLNEGDRVSATLRLNAR